MKNDVVVFSGRFSIAENMTRDEATALVMMCTRRYTSFGYHFYVDVMKYNNLYKVTAQLQFHDLVFRDHPEIFLITREEIGLEVETHKALEAEYQAILVKNPVTI